MTKDILAKELLGAFANIRKLHHHLVDSEFGPAELHVGHVLLENEHENKKPLIAKEIALRTNMSKTILSRVMKNLEQKGMIERIIPAHNHRIVYYNMSQKGKDILFKEAKEMHKQTTQIIEIMGEETTSDLIKNVKKLQEAIQILENQKGS